MSETLALPQTHVRIDVDFFDENEKKKLLAYPTAQQIEQLVLNGLSVPTAEFLTYYLFHKKRPGKPGYRSYSEISRNIDRAIRDLDDWVIFSDETIVSAPDATPQDGAIIERIGESIALSVVNRIHKLHEADWDKIPEHRGRSGFPTFDYRTTVPDIASDGKFVIQAEAKGTAVNNTAEKTASARAQFNKAKEKKQKVAELEAQNRYKYPADIRYGAVCALGYTGSARCWLLDPPAEGAENPRRVRLLNRMRFLSDWFSFITPRSQLAASMATRFIDLLNLEDPFQLSGVPLVRGNGEPFEISRFNPRSRQHGFFRNMSQVVDGPAGGVAMQMPSRDILFLGIREDLLELMAKQDFERLLIYDFPTSTVTKTVRCVISKGRMHNIRLPPELQAAEESRDAYVRFTLTGALHYSRGGLVFGVLPVPKAKAKDDLLK
ncbi:hypothetical protein [Archangium sp. Cb G35]|uniref:hypothetical protein n=1 Tax=Archangium sp. Cb G35 TaxID=1920190 RepID=UPI000AFCF339|nr:hypothetical protein [Archangium sp. Cb G35]